MGDRAGTPMPSSPDGVGLPGRVRGYLWSTEFVMLVDSLAVTPHAHSAIQVMVGLEDGFALDTGEGWRQVRGALVDAGVVHALDCHETLTAIGWVESESRHGQRLRAERLRGRGCRVLAAGEVAAMGAALRPCAGPDVSCADAARRWSDAMQVLGRTAPLVPVDDRIAAVLEHLRSAPTPPPSVEGLCAMAHLSESRLQHLFREQVGVPIRRYLLWHRVLTAMRALVAGASATDAAHAAGFADAAHLSRTARRMNGVTPTGLGPMGEWVSVCP